MRLFEPILLDGEDDVNPNSMEIIEGFVEPQLKEAVGNNKYQFFRHGYFNVDHRLSKDGKLVFNRIVALKSSFKI